MSKATDAVTPTVAELRKKAADLNVEIQKRGKEYNERKTAKKELWPDNTRSEWDRLNKEFDELRPQIDALQADDEMQKRMTELTEWEGRSTRGDKIGLDDSFLGNNRSFGDAGFRTQKEVAEFSKNEIDKRNVMRVFIAGHMEGGSLITEDMRASCISLGVNPGDSFRFNVLPTEDYQTLQRNCRNIHPSLIRDQRSMTKVGVGTGSELVPVTFLQTFELAQLATAELFLYCEMMRTDTGEDLPFPIADDTANEGVQVGEVDDISALAQPDAVLERLTMKSFPFSSGMVLVSNSLNRDSIINIDQLLAFLLGERIARIKLRRATLGNGTTQPGGIITQAAVGNTTALGTAISPTDVIKLQHSVGQPYRPDASFMANDLIVQTLRLLNDAQGRPLWASGLQDGVPDRLCGQRLIYNNYMSSTLATGQSTMVYGSMRYYKAREVGKVIVKILRERYAEKQQTAFLADQSFDSRMARWTNNAVCPIKKLNQG